MAEQKNTFLKGKMNQDLDSRIVPEGEYRFAKNLSLSRSQGDSVGEFENVLGNTEIASLPDATAVVIGNIVDETNNIAFFLAVGTTSYIYQVDLSNNTLQVLVSGDFLNFNVNYRVTGINLIENLLFWTDNLNQPRKINIDKARLDASHYSNEDKISVAKFAPYEPIIVMDMIKTTTTSSVVDSLTIDVNDASEIEIGDIVKDHDRSEYPFVITKTIYVTNIDADTITLSDAVTIDTGFELDFSRPTMKNKSDKFLSNYSTGTYEQEGTATPTVNTVYFTEGDQGDADFVYSSNNGIPRVGDIVTSDLIPVSEGLRVTSVNIDYLNTETQPFVQKQKISLTFNKIPSAALTDIYISSNPDFDLFWKGDSTFLKDKFVRFSYRFEFEDNEYSIIAPFSQPMFIPKQYGEFGGGQKSPTEDMNDAYKSTIVTWFENNIDSILLKIPAEKVSQAEMVSDLGIVKIDILYKESDSLAVKVLETIELDPNDSDVLPSISFKSGHEVIKRFIEHNYNSTKPYKTLPENQTTRVSDRVPLKALAQEVSGNRVIYGNFTDRHTSPSRIPFSATAQRRSTASNNYTQYPKHTLKQSRTYQVGFVLSDKYGRQSDVILSSYDNVTGIPGSTVFHRYNTSSDQESSPVFDWIGDALSIELAEKIGLDNIYNENTNPTGWYSYKIVVKQQEQEYYNVFFPGFVNGYPVIEDNERDESFFTTLIGDNVNKVPRNLREVGPNDKEYNSDEIIYIRVNNPDIVNKPIANLYRTKPWNKQYYPEGVDQEVLTIGTARDTELISIPFVADAAEGEYGSTTTNSVYNYVDDQQYTTVESVDVITRPTGSIPWGKSGPDAPFYNSDANPLIIKCSSAENGKNIVGAKVTVNSSTADPVDEGTLSMVPFLSIAETKPVYSKLDIFWETTSSGNLLELNAAIDASSDNGGLYYTSLSPFSFTEDTAPCSQIGTSFNFQRGNGNIAFPGDIDTGIIEVKDGDGNLIWNTSSSSDSPFEVVENQNSDGFHIKTNEGIYFWYSESILNNPNSGDFKIKLATTYEGIGETYNDVIDLPLITLQNVAPRNISHTLTSISDFANDTEVATLSIDDNGSADIANNTSELVWEFVGGTVTDGSNVTTDLDANDFTFSANVLSRDAVEHSFVEDNIYNLTVKVTDCNGNGLSTTYSNIVFTIGATAQECAVRNGRITRPSNAQQNNIGDIANCGDSIEYQFLVSSTVDYQDGPSNLYPSANGATKIYYNVLKEHNDKLLREASRGETVSLGTTGALGAGGSLVIKPTMTSTAPNGTTANLSYTIQYRATNTDAWGAATDSSNVVLTEQTIESNDDNATVDTWTFDTAGEYRVVTILMNNQACSLTNPIPCQFYVDFEDGTYGPCSTDDDDDGGIGGII